MAKPQSFLPLVEICDNFKLHVSHPSPSFKLASFCLTSNPKSAIGLLYPAVVDKLVQDNVRASKHGKDASWVVVNYEDQPETYQDQTVRLVHFADHLSTPQLRSEAINTLCRTWHTEGDFANVIGGHLWRSELYPVYSNPFGPYDRESVVFEVERAAAALFGVVTYGVHMTVYVPPLLGSDEEIRIWVPTRAKSKQTWGGFLDNSVAGGIPSGMPAFESLVKESMEEASLEENIVREHARGTGAISYFFRTHLGWLQPEVEFVYDLPVPPTATEEEKEKFRPKPLDGEVERFELLPLSEVIERMHKKLFKPNCAIVLIDFLIRKGLITPENEPHYLEIVTRLHGRLDFDRW